MKKWLVDGKFKELTFDEFETLEEKEQLEYHKALTEYRSKEVKRLKLELEELKSSGSTNKAKLDEIQDSILKLDMSRKGFERIAKAQGEAIKQMLEGRGNNVPASLTKQISDFIATNKDKIKEIFDRKAGMLEFAVKVVGDMTTGSASNPDGIPELVGTQIAPPSPVNLKETFIDSLITSFNTDLAAYPYTETLPKDGDFAAVAEGTAKPQLDFEVQTRYAEPSKIAAYEILTDESVKDIRGLQSIATDLLRKKHDLKRQNYLFFGDGIAPNPKGATTFGRLFSAGAMATAVSDPNFMDVVNACVVDIATTHNYQDEMPYMANVVLVSFTDFFLNLVAAKDADGHPLYPTAGLFGRVIIGGITIIPFDDIPAGKIFVADMSKYNVSNYVGYTVQIGWINDQFITNKFTMLGESRFHAFVKKLDEQAFIYDDIATIKTAITAV